MNNTKETNEETEVNVVKNMVTEYGAYYYESTSVGKSRKAKSCDICGASIPKGTASTGAKMFNGDFFQVDFCNSCVDIHSTHMKEMSNGSYDCY